jgi:ribosomal protein L12E/L44/L45/RPP1/RPP2
LDDLLHVHVATSSWAAVKAAKEQEQKEKKERKEAKENDSENVMVCVFADGG